MIELILFVVYGLSALITTLAFLYGIVYNSVKWTIKDIILGGIVTLTPILNTITAVYCITFVLDDIMEKRCG